MSKWQPIETAPTDGTRFDAWAVDPMNSTESRFTDVSMRGDRSGFGFIRDSTPPEWEYIESHEGIYPIWKLTHWMPIPDSPSTEKNERKSDMNRDQELLDMLAEEAAEVIQAVMKVNRHGFESYHPNDPSVNNRELLKQEMIDLKSLIEHVETYIVGNITQSEIDHTWKRKLNYTKFQGGQPK